MNTGILENRNTSTRARIANGSSDDLGLPSPSRSRIAMNPTSLTVWKSTFGANEIVPGVLVFLKTEILKLGFAPLPTPMTMSGFPSPSRSPIAIGEGPISVLKSTFGAKEIEPGCWCFYKLKKLYHYLNCY